MHYLAEFIPDGNGILVSFPDIPEAVTGGVDDKEALANATEALELALLTHAASGMSVPSATQHLHAGGTYHRVPVSAAVTAKIAFIEAFRASGLTRTALAAKLGKAENEVRRMLDPYHQTKLGAIEIGLHVLGKRLVVTVEEAA